MIRAYYTPQQRRHTVVQDRNTAWASTPVTSCGRITDAHVHPLLQPTTSQHHNQHHHQHHQKAPELISGVGVITIMAAGTPQQLWRCQSTPQGNVNPTARPGRHHQQPAAAAIAAGAAARSRPQWQRRQKACAKIMPAATMTHEGNKLGGTSWGWLRRFGPWESVISNHPRPLKTAHTNTTACLSHATGTRGHHTSCSCRRNCIAIQHKQRNPTLMHAHQLCNIWYSAWHKNCRARRHTQVPLGNDATTKDTSKVAIWQHRQAKQATQTCHTQWHTPTCLAMLAATRTLECEQSMLFAASASQHNRMQTRVGTPTCCNNLLLSTRVVQSSTRTIRVEHRVVHSHATQLNRTAPPSSQPSWPEPLPSSSSRKSILNIKMTHPHLQDHDSSSTSRLK
jgi:hypothetical protein